MAGHSPDSPDLSTVRSSTSGSWDWRGQACSATWFRFCLVRHCSLLIRHSLVKVMFRTPSLPQTGFRILGHLRGVQPVSSSSARDNQSQLKWQPEEQIFTKQMFILTSVKYLNGFEQFVTKIIKDLPHHAPRLLTKRIISSHSNNKNGSFRIVL